MVDTIFLITSHIAYTWLKPLVYNGGNYACHILNSDGTEVINDLDKKVKNTISPVISNASVVIVTNTMDELDSCIQECMEIMPEIKTLVVYNYQCKWHESVDWQEFANNNNLILEVIK